MRDENGRALDSVQDRVRPALNNNWVVAFAVPDGLQCLVVDTVLEQNDVASFRQFHSLGEGQRAVAAAGGDLVGCGIGVWRQEEENYHAQEQHQPTAELRGIYLDTPAACDGHHGGR